MNKNTYALALLIPLYMVASSPDASTPEQDVTEADTRFWHAYNHCDMKHIGELLTEDVEFYHDLTGLSVSRTAVVKSLATGPCADSTKRLRRELVGGSQKFHPLAGGYAILSGQHRFYVSEPDKQERVSGQAEFTTLWKLDSGQWRMHRVLSYAHGPVPYTPPPRSLTLPTDTLEIYVGQYHADRAGAISVLRDGDHLKLTAGSFVATLYPETPTRFFAMERDIQFEFEVAADGTAQGLAVYESGVVTERAQRH
jgi:hypothetical protein